MTVTIGPVPRYQWQGLSSDTKPTDSRVGVNDLFFETDTGNEFIYNGVWNAYNLGGGGGGGSSAPVFDNSVTATGATSQNNYSPGAYVAGTTNLILAAAASGGSTCTGLVAAGKNWSALWVNTSATDPWIFPHLSGSSTAANRFSNMNGASVQIPPLGAAQLNYINALTFWQFS